MPKKNNESSEGFVKSDSLKQYATATTLLTFVLNIAMYVYNAVAANNMPSSVLILLALTSSVIYVRIVFKREVGSTLSQYVLITLLNAIMLFTSISGVNSMLDSAYRQIDSQNQTKSETFYYQKNLQPTYASLSDFLKHIIFPTHSWFNPDVSNPDKTKKIITFVVANIDSTKKITDSIIQQKVFDINYIDSLNKTIDTLRADNRYYSELFYNAEKILKERNIPFQTNTVVKSISPSVNDNSLYKKQQIQIQEIRQRQQQLSKIKLQLQNH
jgi:hypothetical protein